MATLKTREYLFRPKPRRARGVLAVALLAGASLAAAMVTGRDGPIYEALAETAVTDEAVGAAFLAAADEDQGAVRLTP